MSAPESDSSFSTGNGDGRRYRAAARWGALLLALTVFELRVVSIVHLPRLGIVLAGTHDICTGHAFWRVFQSRILCPFAVVGAAHILHVPLWRTYLAFAFLCILGANALTFWAFRRRTGSARRAMEYAFAGAALFLMLLDEKWLYSWDYLGVVLFTFFAWGVFERRSWRWFLPLFAVALLNRESALYLPLWMILDAFDRVAVPAVSGGGSDSGPERFGWRLVRPASLAAGVILGAAGAAWTVEIRRLLFHGSPEPSIAHDVHHPYGNFWTPYDNFVAAPHDIVLHPSHWMFVAPYLSYFLLAAFLTNLWRGRKRASAHLGKIAVLVTVMAVAASLTAMINETRVWVEFIPFLLFLYQTMRDAPAGGATAGDSLR